jgi:hypothetical protein
MQHLLAIMTTAAHALFWVAQDRRARSAEESFSFRAQMSMRKPAEYGNDEVPIPVFYVLEIYQGTFRHEKPIVEIRTAEPLSPISVGDYLYEVSFPDPLAVP